MDPNQIEHFPWVSEQDKIGSPKCTGFPGLHGARWVSNNHSFEVLRISPSWVREGFVGDVMWASGPNMASVGP